MPAADSPCVIVARFLKTNNYTEVQAFLAEAGLSPDAGSVSKGDLTLETLLDEKKTFDLSVRFEKLGVDDSNAGWTADAPSYPNAVVTLPSTSNILSVSGETIGSDDAKYTLLLSSTADRRLNVLHTPTGALKYSLTDLHDSPVLACAVFGGRYLLTASMSGNLLLSTIDGKPLDKRRDHSKFVVKVAVHETKDLTWIATAGWDAKVMLYRLPTASYLTSIGEPFGSVSLATNPEALAFITHPDDGAPTLILTRRDSTFLYYYTAEKEPRMLGRQNLAPHSIAWIAFTPSAIALHPADPTLLAVATSAVPHMKLLIVRLLLPPLRSEASVRPTDPTAQVLRTSLLDDGPATETQASQARAALAVAEKEHVAILIHCNTLAPQTPYSTPALAWRPDGCGVWVNGDDGAVRGIDASSGKVVSTLKAHDPGTKVRCLWAGFVENRGSKEEWLVSGGFDQKLIIWKPGT